MEIISRQDAISQGLVIYFTGTPCKNGHISKHHIKGGCCECKRLGGIARYEADKDRAKARQKAYRIANPEKEKLRNAEYHQRNKEAISKKQAIWRNENKETASANGAKWREANQERVKYLVSTWQAKNKDKRRVHKQNRRGRLGGGKLSRDLAGRLFVMQRGLCACCGKTLGDDYHLDHIMPLALGGENVDSNMQLLRQRCNNQKRDKHPISFMQSRGFLL